MDTLKLSAQLNVPHDFILHLMTAFNGGPVDEDVIISMCDPEFIKLFTKQARSFKFKSVKNEIESVVFNDWAADLDLSGFSTKEIGDMATGGPYDNMKQVSRLMRSSGYESKVIYLGNDKQGRRWFKVGDPDIEDAKARAKYEYNTPVSFL